MLLAIIVLALSLAAVLAIRHIGLASTSFVALAATLCLYPQLLSARSEIYHVGIAPPVIEIRTFTVAIVLVAALSAWKSQTLPIPRIWIPFVAWFLLCFTLVWPRTPEQWSGLWHYGLGILAFAVGGWIASRFTLARHSRLLVNTIFVIVLIQCVVVVLQIAGLPINAVSEADAADIGSRVNGTHNHPNNLGKMLVLLMALILPQTKAIDQKTQYRATAAVFLAFVPLALAEGRANLVAALLMVLTWIVIQPSARPMPAGRIAVALGLFAAAFSSIILLQRFEEDPTGGARSELMTIAYRYLPELIWTGTGPNTYTTFVSARTESTIPVHNSFLLQIAELGFVGFVAFAIPVLATMARCIRHFRSAGVAGDDSRAFLVLLPGLALIGATGWGMLGNSILPLWMLVTGYYYRRTDPSHPDQDSSKASRSEASIAPRL